MALVRWAAETNRPTKDGSSTRDHLDAAARAGSKTAIALLTPPPMPPVFAHLWIWWLELSSGRATGGMGIAAITWLDLDAWSRHTRTRPSAFEARLLMKMDRIFCRGVMPETT